MSTSRIASLVVVAVACHGTPPAPAARPLEVHVDRRVELLAILQRLAGGREYQTAPATAYVRDVDAQFAPVASHRAVALTRELRARGLDHDLPMTIAVYLDDQLHLRARPDDPRIAAIDAEAYVASVAEFANASGFDAFFAKHHAYYERVEARLRDAIDAENPRPWLDRFFGQRAGPRFVVVPAPLAGTWNYGPRAGDEMYQVMGLAKVDFDELPVVDGQMIELLVHEMTHSYINPLFAKHRGELEAQGQRLFARVEQAMRAQAYPSWEIVMNESAVRAVTALYERERHGADAGAAAVKREVARSFVWTEPLVQLLSSYEADRVRYPTLDAFVPQLVTGLAALP